jgi:hypothetical protein
MVRGVDRNGDGKVGREEIYARFVENRRGLV